jgi:hypothetical protein
VCLVELVALDQHQGQLTDDPAAPVRTLNRPAHDSREINRVHARPVKCNVPVAEAINDEAVLPERVHDALGQLVRAARQTDITQKVPRRQGQPPVDAPGACSGHQQPTSSRRIEQVRLNDAAIVEPPKPELS